MNPQILRARFASPEMAPIDPATARHIAEQHAQLGAYVADLCLTVDTLWSENERLQEGVDRNLGLVAELRGELGRIAARIRELEDEQSRARGVLGEFASAKSHDLCHWHPETLKKLAAILGVPVPLPTDLPPRAAFRNGCLAYEEQLYAEIGQ